MGWSCGEYSVLVEGACPGRYGYPWYGLQLIPLDMSHMSKVSYSHTGTIRSWIRLSTSSTNVPLAWQTSNLRR